MKQKSMSDYFVFGVLNVDSLGRNFRVAEVRDNRSFGHKLLTEIHPYLLKNTADWEKAVSVFKKIETANLPFLYYPEKITKKGDGTQFIFPHLRGKVLDQVLEDARRRSIPIRFGLAFSILLTIASLLEEASAIALDGTGSFHGFLTPDHIMVDFEGNFYFKYYGLWMFLDKDDDANAQMVKKYGSWLTPEFIRGERLVERSDIFHLGYLAFRMLTGNYFCYLPGEDFETAFTNISFITDLPSTEKSFLTSLINFFKKTLSPDSSRRFSGLKEFKDYIIRHFQFDELTVFKTNMATYMTLLYFDSLEKEKKLLQEETSQRSFPGGRMYETMKLTGKLDDLARDLPEIKSMRARYMALAALLLIALCVGGFLIYNQSQKVKREQEIASQLIEQQNLERQSYQKKMADMQKKLQYLEGQKTNTPEEEKAREQEIARLKKLKEEHEKKGEQNFKEPVSGPKKEESQKKGEGGITQPVIEDVKNENVGLEEKTKPTGKSEETGIIGDKVLEKEEVKEIQPFYLSEVNEPPQKLAGQDPQFSLALKRTYAGRRATIQANLLIDEKGSVRQVDILTSIPGDIEKEVIQGLRQWQYSPGKKAGNIVHVWVPIKLKIFIK